MFQLFRFVQRIEAAVSPTFNSLITVGDTVLEVFSKLQGLLTIRSLRAIITTQYTGGASTTADQNINTLTIPAGQFQIGDTLQVTVRGLWSKPNSGGTSINFWVKVNGTKITTITYTPGATATALPFKVDADLVCRTIGGTGTIFANGDAFINTNATTGFARIQGNGINQTVDTTAAVTITVGYNFSNSNASNNITANIANIIMR